MAGFDSEDSEVNIYADAKAPSSEGDNAASTNASPAVGAVQTASGGQAA